MPVKAPQRHEVSVQEVVNISVDFQGMMDANQSPIELLTGTPTVTEYGSPQVLTLGGKQVNSSTITVNGATCLAGQAVQFTCDASGATPGQVYIIDIVCGTTASQTRAGSVAIHVVR